MQTEPPKTDPPKRKRRWFQFSLRSLLIFTVISAAESAELRRRIERNKKREAVVPILKLHDRESFDVDLSLFRFDTIWTMGLGR
jgi:hypothetical protein